MMTVDRSANSTNDSAPFSGADRWQRLYGGCGQPLYSQTIMAQMQQRATVSSSRTTSRLMTLFEQFKNPARDYWLGNYYSTH